MFDKEKLLDDLRRDEGQPARTRCGPAAGGWARRRSSRALPTLGPATPVRRRRPLGPGADAGRDSTAAPDTKPAKQIAVPHDTRSTKLIVRRRRLCAAAGPVAG